MLWRTAVYIVFSVCFAVCQGSDISAYDLSTSDQQNETRRWLMEVQLQQDGQPWNLNVSHATGAIFIKISPLSGQVTDVGVTETRSSSGTHSNYEEVPGLGYYKFHRKAKSWYEAKNICENEGGHLAIFNSDQEVQILKLMTAKQICKDKSYWIGFHDEYQEGTYVTIFNDTLKSAGYTKWYTNQPYQGKTWNCGCFSYHSVTNDFGLGTSACTNDLPFICEQ
ncbi:Hemolymph lipopolysaccharide-binding protein [Blattella germanica]|nr:Hemolymph lipopolysaccharide-binding protein [Blattella germanica]